MKGLRAVGRLVIGIHKRFMGVFKGVFKGVFEFGFSQDCVTVLL